MESNKPTIEEWKARALSAERSLYNINDQICGSNFIYGDGCDCVEEMADLGEAIWEAAGSSLDEVPTPPEVVRQQTDRRPDCQDRVLHAIYNTRHPIDGALLAVGRSNDSSSAIAMMKARWNELVAKKALASDGIVRWFIVDLHRGHTPIVPGWSEAELRTVLLEGDPSHRPRLVEDHLKLDA